MSCHAGTVWCAVSWPRRSALDANMCSTAPGIMNTDFCSMLYYNIHNICDLSNYINKDLQCAKCLNKFFLKLSRACI
jgi:hypothetical protein